MTRGRHQLAAAAAVLTLATGCAGPTPAPQPPEQAAHSRTTDRAAGGLEAARGFRVRRSYQPTPVPVRIRIPKIQVTTSLEPLGRAPDGTVEVPNRVRPCRLVRPRPTTRRPRVGGHPRTR
jgi:hypothetical protein